MNHPPLERAQRADAHAGILREAGRVVRPGCPAVAAPAVAARVRLRAAVLIARLTVDLVMKR